MQSGPKVYIPSKRLSICCHCHINRAFHKTLKGHSVLSELEQCLDSLHNKFLKGTSLFAPKLKSSRELLYNYEMLKAVP